MDQVAADVTTHLFKRLYRDHLMATADMTAERGAWRGGGYGATSMASTDVVTNQASAHLQMSRASLDKRRFDPNWNCYRLSRVS